MEHCQSIIETRQRGGLNVYDPLCQRGVLGRLEKGRLLCIG